MENPDVELEISVDKDDRTAKLSYKVNSRKEDDSKSAIEFVEMVIAIFGGENEADES